MVGRTSILVGLVAVALGVGVVFQDKAVDIAKFHILPLVFRVESVFYDVDEYPEHRMIVKTRTDPPFVMVLPTPEMDQVIPYFLLKTGVWEPHLTDLFKYLLHDCTKDKLVIDAGANSGYYGLYAAAMGCDVIAIEPQVRLTELVNQSVVLNGYDDRFLMVPAALTNFAGRTHIGIGSTRWGGARVVDRVSDRMMKSGFIKEVPAITLDDLVPTGDIFFLKIDCEGHEETILSGAQNLIQNRRVRHLLLEVFPDSDLYQTLIGLCDLGYAVHDSAEPAVEIPRNDLHNWLETTVAGYKNGEPMKEVFLTLHVA